MKKIVYFFVCIGLLQTQIVQAQDNEKLDLGKLKLNFAVPDMPAFNVLGTEPSNLLRPSTPKELAVSFSEFFQNSRFIIPKAFALEVSPSLLINSKKGPQQLKHYIDHQVINSLRVSIGTSVDTVLSPSGRSSGIGARISLINKGDFPREVMQQIADRLRIFRKQIEEHFEGEFAVRNGIDTANVVDWEAKLREEPLRSKFDKELADTASNMAQAEFMRDIKAIKERYKRDHWNDEKLDVAVALLASSPDSLIKKLRFNRASFWLTYAAKMGSSGQLLLGIYAYTSKDLTDTNKETMNKSYQYISIPVRYFLGTNRVKAFAETQYSYVGREEAHKVLVNLGSELNVTDGFWFTFYGGMDYNSKVGKASFVTSLNLKVTLPENFNLF
jgi:hypothetical protein